MKSEVRNPKPERSPKSEIEGWYLGFVSFCAFEFWAPILRAKLVSVTSSVPQPSAARSATGRPPKIAGRNLVHLGANTVTY
jgi:hypothetical protein